jgi:hypothetical protein
MWGEVTPAERLRAVTRRNVDDDYLAAEAADALGGFASEPASLVVACRRVLGHHRTHGALWWVCARILAAPDPAAAARAAARELHDDPTADRLGATLPILDEDEVVAVIGWTAIVDDALVERFDLDVVAIPVEGADPVRALRRRRSGHAVRVVDEWEAARLRIPRVLVSALAIGPERVLVPAGTADALDAIGTAAAETWIIGGVGRVLPSRMYDVVVASTREAESVEEISLQRADRIAGPRGVERAVDAVSRIDCPIAPELLRPLD